jgi:hypothetical protein
VNADIKGWRRLMLRWLLPSGVHAVFIADGIVAVETLDDVTLTPVSSPPGGTRLEAGWRGHLPYAPSSIARVRIKA